VNPSAILNLGLALVLFSFVALGEDGGAPPPNVTVNVQQPAQSPWPGQGQKILTDDVFKGLGSTPSGPTTSKSSYSGSVRTLTPEEDANSATRSEWLRACKRFQGKDMEAYRQCFAEEKAKSAENLRQSRDLVERRQGMPMRNTQGVPLIEEGENAFGGVQSESSEEND